MTDPVEPHPKPQQQGTGAQRESTMPGTQSGRLRRANGVSRARLIWLIAMLLAIAVVSTVAGYLLTDSPPLATRELRFRDISVRFRTPPATPLEPNYVGMHALTLSGSVSQFQVYPCVSSLRPVNAPPLTSAATALGAAATRPAPVRPSRSVAGTLPGSTGGAVAASASPSTRPKQCQIPVAKAWSLHSTTASAPLGISNLALSPTSPGCEALSLIGQVSDGELNVELQGAPQQKCTLAFSATIEAGRVPLATFNDEDDRPVTVKLSGASPPLVSGSTRGSLHVGLRQAEGRFLNPVELANIASLGGELAESAFRFAGGSRSVCSAARGQRIILERDGWKIESVELRGGSFVVRARVEAPQLSICPAELVALEPRHCSSEPEPGCHFDVAQYWKWVSYVAGALAGVVALVLSILGFKGPGT